MSIVSSSYTTGPVQACGRRYVTEQHTDHLGATHIFDYLASDSMDKDAILSARAVQLVNDLAEAEANALLQS